MVKKYAFCNDICKGTTISHTNCNYNKVVRDRRLLKKNYVILDYDSLTENQVKDEPASERANEPASAHSREIEVSFYYYYCSLSISIEADRRGTQRRFPTRSEG